MAAHERSGIRAVVPWVALSIVTIFAFGQLSQRNQAMSRAVKAEDDLLAMERLSGARTPIAAHAPASASHSASPGPRGITEREQKLDAALQQALEIHRSDSTRIATLLAERDAERARAARLGAQRDTEAARAAALAEQLTLERSGRAADGAALEAERADDEGRAAELRSALSELEARAAKHEARLQERLQAVSERADQLAVELTTVRAAAAQASADAQEKARMRAREGEQERAGFEAERKRLRAELARTQERVAGQLEVTASALEKTQAELRRAAETLQSAAREQARAEERGAAAEAALAALRKHLRAAATAQLAAEDSETLLSGARMVGLLKLNGSAGRLLALTDHDDGAVAAAAARALAAVPDLPAFALPASDAAVALLADEAIGVRLAGVALLEAATGQSASFDPGASPEVRAAALAKLKNRLGS